MIIDVRGIKMYAVNPVPTSSIAGLTPRTGKEAKERRQRLVTAGFPDATIYPIAYVYPQGVRYYPDLDRLIDGELPDALGPGALGPDEYDLDALAADLIENGYILGGDVWELDISDEDLYFVAENHLR